MANGKALPEATEVWAREPYHYARQLLKADLPRLVFQHHPAADFWRFCWTNFPDSAWRALVIDDDLAYELGPRNSMLNPAAVYPTFRYGLDSITDIPKLIERGPDIVRERLEGRGIRPIPVIANNQEQRVILSGAPKGTNGSLVDKFFVVMHKVQQRYPSAILHLHDVDPIAHWAFGTAIRSIDFDFNNRVLKNRIILPTGRTLAIDDLRHQRGWVKILGFNVAALRRRPQEVLAFNLEALKWAAESWNDEERYRQKLNNVLTQEEYTEFLRGRTPTFELAPRMGNKNRRLDITTEDKLVCDSCSLALSCRLYRRGSICTMPGTSGKELAAYFQTRDSSVVLDGIGKLIEEQSERYVEGREREVDDDSLDEHVTTIMKNLMASAVQYAKFIDPSLRSAAVAVNINSTTTNNTAVLNSTAVPTGNTLVAAIVHELEAGGIPREEVTVAMIQRAMRESPKEVIAQWNQPTLEAGSGDDDIADAEIIG